MTPESTSQLQIDSNQQTTDQDELYPQLSPQQLLQLLELLRQHEGKAEEQEEASVTQIVSANDGLPGLSGEADEQKAARESEDPEHAHEQ